MPGGRKIDVTSDKRGIDSHGIGRFVPIYVDRLDDGILNPVTRLEVVKDRGATAVVDANNGFGHVAGVFAANLAIEKAKNFGLGMVAVKNSSHYGFAGYYAMMAAKEGMIGLTGTNARPSIAPTFGVENMLGTNPLTFAIPTDEEFPFVLDCATSVSQRGRIEVYAREGKTLPSGWAIDRRGHSERIRTAFWRSSSPEKRADAWAASAKRDPDTRVRLRHRGGEFSRRP